MPYKIHDKFLFLVVCFVSLEVFIREMPAYAVCISMPVASFIDRLLRLLTDVVKMS